MGRFVNAGNNAFQVTLNSEIYVDKTGLLEYTNHVMDTNSKFICNSRPRRFGKSITADMLTAYYCIGCDSENMFAGLQISNSPDFHVRLTNTEKTVHYNNSLKKKLLIAGWLFFIPVRTEPPRKNSHMPLS